VSQPCVNDCDELSQWKMARIQPLANLRPLSQSRKNMKQVMASTRTPCAKFRANLSIGGFSANGWNITKSFYFHKIFDGRPTGQTGRWIFTHKRHGLTQVCAFLEVENSKSISKPWKIPQSQKLGQKRTSKFLAKNDSVETALNRHHRPIKVVQ